MKMAQWTAKNARQHHTGSVDQKGDAPAIRGHSEKVPETASPRRHARSRQSHDRDEERNERQRREELYQRWEAFKAKQRSDKHAWLKQRLALQHELIAAQEELHHQRQLDEQQRQAQIREAKCQERRSMQEALTQHGKIDFESERREARTKRRAARALAPKLQQASLEPGDKHNGTEPTGINRKLSVITSRMEHHKGQLSVVSSSDEENEERDDDGSLDEEEMLPHQQDLCRIFGRQQAAYFLRPRIEPEQKKVVIVPQSLRKLGGRAGVNTLWGTLREHSKVKLQRADSKIPQELKAAYSAFIRECVTKSKTAAKRGFFREDEIPDSDKLQDGLHHQQVQDIQRQVQLMYRAAMTNEDKATVLLHNNPIPDCNNLKGEEGPLRYHPSWLQDDPEEDEPSYKKWLQDVTFPQPRLPPLEEPQPTTSPSKPQRKNSDEILDLLFDLREEKRPEADKERPKKRLSFLTEAEATVPGQFRKRWQEKRDPAGRFIPGQEVMARASMDGSGDGLINNSKQGLSKVRSSTAPPPSSSHASSQSSGSQRKVQTARKDWQPLSLNALEDYKPAVHLLGQGDFAQGQEFMWKPIVANTGGK